MIVAMDARASARGRHIGRCTQPLDQCIAIVQHFAGDRAGLFRQLFELLLQLRQQRFSLADGLTRQLFDIGHRQGFDLEVRAVRLGRKRLVHFRGALAKQCTD